MATLVSGINVSNGTIVTPAILNAAPTLTQGTIVPADLSTGAPSWTSGGNLAVSGNLTTTGTVTATSFAGSGAALTGITTIPTGAIMPFAMNSAPSGWLAADGSIISRTTYSSLFAALGTLYGAGDGSTTFALPDLRGYFVRGSGTNSDGTASGAFGTKQADAFQGHHHSASTTAVQGAGPGGAVGNPGGNFGGASVTVGDPTTDGTNGTPRTASETRPKNIAMLYCIKT